MPASDRWTQSSRDHKNKVMGFDITRESSIEKSCSFALEGKVSAQSFKIKTKTWFSGTVEKIDGVL